MNADRFGIGLVHVDMPVGFQRFKYPWAAVLHADVALMIADNTVADGEPEPGSIGLGGKEWLEYFGLFLSADSRAGVAPAQPDNYLNGPEISETHG